MKFSVLIANYNNGRYIEEAIRSVLSQTYKNWEIIIIDDASEDDSRKILDTYLHDNRVNIYYNKENRGCGYTKWRCIEKASGDICGFLDPDDMLVSNALEEVVKAHSLFDGISIAYSSHFICDENLNIRTISTYTKNVVPNQRYLLFSDGSISHFASFKKSMYMRTRGINPKLVKAVDQDLYYKLEEVGKTLFIDMPLYYYRHNRNSISLGKNELSARIAQNEIIISACNRRIKNAADYWEKFIYRVRKRKAVLDLKDLQKNHYNHFERMIVSYLIRIILKVC